MKSRLGSIGADSGWPANAGYCIVLSATRSACKGNYTRQRRPIASSRSRYVATLLVGLGEILTARFSDNHPLKPSSVSKAFVCVTCGIMELEGEGLGCVWGPGFRHEDGEELGNG